MNTTKLQVLMLALSLVVLFSSVQSRPVDNQTECYTDNNVIKELSQKFYCTVLMMYDQVQKVKQVMYVSVLIWCDMHICIHMCISVYVNVQACVNMQQVINWGIKISMSYIFPSSAKSELYSTSALRREVQ